MTAALLLAACNSSSGGSASGTPAAPGLLGGQAPGQITPPQILISTPPPAPSLPGSPGTPAPTDEEASLTRDQRQAPPAFSIGEKKYAPIDILRSELSIRADKSARRFVAHSQLTFRARKGAVPVFAFDLSQSLLIHATLDGAPVDLKSVRAPDPELTLQALPSECLEWNRDHALVIDYELRADTAVFDSVDGQPRLGLFMTDVSFVSTGGDPQHYLERYAPANLEFDSYPLSIELDLQDCDAEGAQLFSNGEVSRQGKSGWRVEFPAYFTSSSPYFHLTRGKSVDQFTYAGINKKIPVTLYAEDHLEDSHRAIVQALGDLESTFGPYSHDSVTVYSISKFGKDAGGMEYSGATMTEPFAIGHELAHSWFARGVMPRDGDAGWMDEAIVTWWEYGMKPRKTPPSNPARLSQFGPYHASTPIEAYRQGAALIAYLDTRLVGSGGMKSLLREWYTERSHQTVSTGEFERFVSSFAPLSQDGASLDALFNEHVYAKGTHREAFLKGPDDDVTAGAHPKTLTRQQLIQVL